MKKIEQVYREILYRTIEKNKRVFTQLELSKSLGFSLSTINLAVKKLEKINSVKIEKMQFRVIDLKKIIYLWASNRNFDRDIIYSTRINLPVREIERNIPNMIYACYSAYKFKFNDVPADYSEVYVYASVEELEKLKKRFPEKKGKANLIVLKKDKNLERYDKTGTIAQIFVDIWNLREWYASDFIKYMEEKIKL